MPRGLRGAGDARMPSPTDDGPLPGGTANHGRVIRVGDTVHRPCGSHTAAVHALLNHLAQSGFAGSPRVLELRHRTEVLGYIEGESAIEPLEPWALTDDALRSVGALLADLHRHARTFPGTAHPWQRPVPERWRTTIVTHNDVNPANVIFRAGRAVGLIDFDLAAAGCEAWELAVTTCFWAPLRDTADILDVRRDDHLRRVGVLLDGYGAGGDLRRDVARACVDANRWIAGIIRDASEQGHPAFGRVWAEHAAMYDRADAWVGAHGDQIAAAVR